MCFVSPAIGGAVYAQGFSVVTVQSSSFTGNVASFLASALYITSCTYVDVQGITLSAPSFPKFVAKHATWAASPMCCTFSEETYRGDLQKLEAIHSGIWMS